MITIDNLINGRNHVMKLGEKTKNLQELLDKVIKPLEEEKVNYTITVIKGLISTDELDNVHNIFQKIAHIYGKGVDLTTGNTDKDKDCVNFVNTIPCAHAIMLTNSFHVTYDSDDDSTTEENTMDLNLDDGILIQNN